MAQASLLAVPMKLVETPIRSTHVAELADISPPPHELAKVEAFAADLKGQLFTAGPEDGQAAVALSKAAKNAAAGSLHSSDVQQKLANPAQRHQRALTQALSAKNAAVVDGKIQESGQLDVDAIKKASRFSLVLDNPKADDTLLAAGIAIANGVPSLYVVPERKSLPWFLREADQTYPGTVHILEEPIPAAAKKAIKQGGEQLYGTRAEAGPIGASVDTFIGCLMSGLTETQYAEGRSHLMAIDSALKDKLGASKNHCEGIMVASTNSFGTPKESLAMDVEAIRAADRCVFYLYDGQPRPSGMWVEAGVAIGLDKPCTFLVPSRDALPPALRGEELPKGVQVVVYSDHAALLAGLESKPAGLLGEGKV